MRSCQLLHELWKKQLVLSKIELGEGRGKIELGEDSLLWQEGGWELVLLYADNACPIAQISLLWFMTHYCFLPPSGVHKHLFQRGRRRAGQTCWGPLFR